MLTTLSLSKLLFAETLNMSTPLSCHLCTVQEMMEEVLNKTGGDMKGCNQRPLLAGSCYL